MAHQTYSRFAALLGMINRRVATSLLAIGLVVGGIAALAWAQNASLWNPGTQPQAGMGSGNTKIPAKAAQNCQSGQFANGVDAAGRFTCTVASTPATPTCNPSTIANGTVGAYPGCQISCNSGYTLQAGVCVANPAPAVACYRHEVQTQGGATGCETSAIRYTANAELSYNPPPGRQICNVITDPIAIGSAEAASCPTQTAACVWSAEVQLGSELVIQDCTNTRNNIGTCVGNPGGTSPSSTGNRHECITRITGGPGTCWLYGRQPVNAVTGAACSNVDP